MPWLSSDTPAITARMPNSKPDVQARKDSSVTRSPTKLSRDSGNISDASQASHASPQKSRTSSQGQQYQNNIVAEDSGPKRGNKALAAPKRISHPDVNAFLKHMATHDRRRSSSLDSASVYSRDSSGSSRKFKFTPQYAARGHGDMMPRAFQRSPTSERHEPANTKPQGQITQAVWQELERQQKSREAKYSSLEKQSTATKYGPVASNSVLQRALKEREGGYRYGVGS